MARKIKYDLPVGAHSGRLTIIGIPTERSAHGHLLFPVRCDCGNEYKCTSTHFLSQKYGCRNCGLMLRSRDERNRHLGKVLNGWVIEALAGENSSGVPLFQCRCEHCGNTSLRTYGQVCLSKTKFCERCEPDYHFRIEGKTAIGTLPDGTEFLIDAKYIPIVAPLYWHLSNKYLSTTVREDGRCRMLPLHRFIVHAAEGDVVDHINRNPMDCREENLRVVTSQLNSYNRSYPKKSVSGYRGVTWMKGTKKYQARIGFCDRDIHLGVTYNPIEAAQLYNIAARFLYGEYAGELNDVPFPPERVIRRALFRCKPYAAEAERIRNKANRPTAKQETLRTVGRA